MAKKKNRKVPSPDGTIYPSTVENIYAAFKGLNIHSAMSSMKPFEPPFYIRDGVFMMPDGPTAPTPSQYAAAVMRANAIELWMNEPTPGNQNSVPPYMTIGVFAPMFMPPPERREQRWTRFGWNGSRILDSFDPNDFNGIIDGARETAMKPSEARVARGVYEYLSKISDSSVLLVDMLRDLPESALKGWLKNEAQMSYWADRMFSGKYSEVDTMSLARPLKTVDFSPTGITLQTQHAIATHIVQDLARLYHRTREFGDDESVTLALDMFAKVAGFPVKKIEMLADPIKVLGIRRNDPSFLEGIIRGLLGAGRNMTRPPSLITQYEKLWQSLGFERRGQHQYQALARTFMQTQYSGISQITEQNDTIAGTISNFPIEMLAKGETEMMWQGKEAYSYMWMLYKLLRFAVSRTSAIVFTADAIYFSLLPEEIHQLKEDTELFDPKSANAATEGTRLHSRQGPAMRWSKDMQLYAYMGVLVPAHIIMHPEALDGKVALAEPNLEVRRVIIDIIGAEKLLKDAKAQMTHYDEFGWLFRIELPVDRQRWPPSEEAIGVLKVTNATVNADGLTYKDYYMLVPPTMETAREAVAWTFRMRADQYHPKLEA